MIRSLLTFLILGSSMAANIAFAKTDAITRARYDLKLGFTVGGKVSVNHIKPGDYVQKGDVLIELLDKEGNAQIKIWEFRAKSTVAAESADAKQKLAKLEEDITRELVEVKKSGNPFELKRAELKTKIETLNAKQAKMDQHEATFQLAIYKARHERQILRAPIGGMIEQLLVEEGETVQSLKPVLRLVVTDPLRIDAAVATEQTLKLKNGDDVWITYKLAGHEKPIKGHIIFLAEVVDSASDTRLVRIEFANPDKLPAGGQVSVRFKKPPSTKK